MMIASKLLSFATVVPKLVASGWYSDKNPIDSDELSSTIKPSEDLNSNSLGYSKHYILDTKYASLPSRFGKHVSPSGDSLTFSKSAVNLIQPTWLQDPPHKPRPRLRAEFSFAPETEAESEGPGSPSLSECQVESPETSDPPKPQLSRGSSCLSGATASSTRTNSTNTPSLYGSYICKSQTPSPTSPNHLPWITTTITVSDPEVNEGIPVRPPLRRTKACADLSKIFWAMAQEQEDDDALEEHIERIMDSQLGKKYPYPTAVNPAHHINSHANRI